MKEKIIYCIGDSHVSFFSGIDNIIPMWNKNNNVNKSGKIKYFEIFRLGAFTAYNLYRNDESKKRIMEALSVIKKNSNILLCFGEIDCRCHIVKQSEIQNKSIDVVSNECARRYIDTINEIKNNGYNIIVWNIIPPYSVKNECGVFTEYGTLEQRKNAAVCFNKYIHENINSDIFFLYIYDKVSDKNGFALNGIFFDEIHLSQYSMPFVIEKLIKYKYI